MAAPFNSATRILSQLEPFLMVADGQPAVTAWAEIFKVQAGGVELHYLVSKRLILIFEEIRALEGILRQQGLVDPDVYAPALSQASVGFSPLQLAHDVSVARQHLSSSLHTLKLLKGVVRSDEVEATEEQLQEMASLIAQLQEVIAASTLPPSLVSMFREYIELFRRALGDYPIAGPRAIRDALRNMRPGLLENYDDLNANADAEEVKLGQKLWHHATEIGAKAGTVNDIYGATVLAWEVSKTVWALATGK